LRDASVNVLGTLALLRCAARQEVARFVFASTGGAIYGEVPAGLARVGDHERPASPYACSKLAAESYVRWAGLELGVPSTILRYANVYGPRQDPHGEAGVVAIFSERILRGEPLRVNARTHEGDPGCVRDYVHVDDVVHANLEAIAGRLREPVVHVATGVATCTADLADALQAAAGRQVPRTSGPRRAGDLERSVLAPSPELPPPRSLEEGLRSTMDWFRGRTRPA
jgi:UDP-glucose 4-epimerase